MGNEQDDRHRPRAGVEAAFWQRRLGASQNTLGRPCGGEFDVAQMPIIVEHIGAPEITPG
jgi:hypothetical protein